MSEQDGQEKTGAEQNRQESDASSKAGAGKGKRSRSGRKRLLGARREKKPPSRRRRTAILVGVFLIGLILALGAAVGTAYLWFVGSPQTRHLQAEVGALQRQVQNQANKLGQQGHKLGRLDSLAQTQQKLLRRTRRQSNDLSGLNQKIASADKKITQLSDLVQGGRQVWLLDEVEELLLMANDRLALRNDISGALQAFQIAQRRLGRISDPRLTPVRKQLARQIAALQAAPKLDVEGMALKLSSLEDRVRGLPLKQHAPRNYHAQGGGGQGRAGQPWWQRLGDSIAGTLRGLVRIRRTDKAYQPLLAPKESFFLYQNLELKLESARQALLRRHNHVFHDSVQTALKWLRAYFQSSASGVRAMTQALHNMQGKNLEPHIPNTGKALAALRRQVQNRGDNGRHTHFKPAAPVSGQSDATGGSGQ